MTPHFPKPRFFAKFHPGMVVDILFFQKWHLALALGPIWGGALGALGPIWGSALERPKADIMEAEGRLNGGLGAEPPGQKTI